MEKVAKSLRRSVYDAVNRKFNLRGWYEEAPEAVVHLADKELPDELKFDKYNHFYSRGPEFYGLGKDGRLHEIVVPFKEGYDDLTFKHIHRSITGMEYSVILFIEYSQLGGFGRITAYKAPEFEELVQRDIARWEEWVKA